MNNQPKIALLGLMTVMVASAFIPSASASCETNYATELSDAGGSMIANGQPIPFVAASQTGAGELVQCSGHGAVAVFLPGGK